MTRDLYLAIDVGTGSIRAALVDLNGQICAISHKEHEQIVPQYGWSEQRPLDWWEGTCACVLDVLTKVENANTQVAAICVCGQMHGTVLLGEDGQTTRDTAPLWNDKRTQGEVDAFLSSTDPLSMQQVVANMPAPAWPAFKLMWLAKNDPEALSKTVSVLMPKDWINYKLTGEVAQDFTETSMSYLMDHKTKDWSCEAIKATGVSRKILPTIRSPFDVLSGLSSQAASALGLDANIPVVCGAGDYPAALLGSGVIREGMASDVTGTSTIITVIGASPLLDPNVSNVATVEGNWGSLTLLDAGGDAVRWARRAFHDNRRDYGDVAELATHAQAGSKSLFFLPYLSGERFGAAPNSRAQFFGLTAKHQLSDLHRSVLEGVAFSVRMHLDKIIEKTRKPEAFVASGGGAKSKLWMEIKASMYDTPYLVPEELECGIVGAAMMMSVATGQCANIEKSADQMVKYAERIEPNPKWRDLYSEMMPIYNDIYSSSQQYYNRLDALDRFA